MASQSFSSTSRSVGTFDERKCLCGQVAMIRTSWSAKNPGRRFYQCAVIVGGKPACNYFDWVDPPGEHGTLDSNNLSMNLDRARDEDGKERKELHLALAKRETKIANLEVALAESKKREEMYLNLLVGVMILIAFVSVMAIMRM